MNDSTILLLTALSSIIFSYIVVTLFDTDGTTDDALSRDLNQLLMQMSTLMVSILFEPMQELASISIGLLTMLITRLKWVVVFLMFLALTLLMHYYHASILTIVDDGWTCAVAPLMKNIFTPLLQVARLFYALFIPIVNAFIVLHGQLLKAWYITAVKCNQRVFLSAFGEGALVVKSFSASTAGFFGYASTNENSGGNFMTNDFKFGDALSHGMKALSMMENVAICACARFELPLNLLFIPTREPHLVAAIDNYYQMFVRIGQSFFSIIEGKLPDIYRINFKYERYLLELGMAMDSIMFEGFEKVLYELSIGLTQGTAVEKQKHAFVLKNRPLEGPFTISAHNTVALWHAATTIGFNGPLHLMAIFDNKHQTSFDVEMWSMTKSLSQLHKAVYAQASLMQWLTYVIKTFVTDADTALQILKEETIPLDLHCDWADDVAQYRLVPLHETVGCSYYYYGIYTWNIPFIAWGAIVELLIKSVFSNKQDMFRTLQRWEGPSIARNKVYDCQERASLSAYDYSMVESPDNNPYLGGWIWTQDGGKCQCDFHYGSTLDENEPVYNPWCGQPNLNFDVFAPMDAMIMHLSHGILGPGFGDAFPFVDISDAGVGIKVEGPDGELVDKFIKIPRALVPITRTAVESARVLIRVALSWNDIVTGHWFNYPVNCGHGLNNLHIEKKFITRLTLRGAQGDLPQYWTSLTAVQKNAQRWNGCGEKKYKSTSKQLKICEDNENSDCMCSYLRPLKSTSPCMCISRYPDLDVTASNQEVGDLLDDRFTSAAVSEHWCNSLIIEWTFQNTGAFADALDYMVSLGPINPNCDVADRASNGESLASDKPENRTKSVYLIANTPTLSFLGQFVDAKTKLNHIKDLYADSETGCTVKLGETVNGTWRRAEWFCDDSERFKSISELNDFTFKDWSHISARNRDIKQVQETTPGCRIWGRFDFFCSAGLYVRNSKRLTMNIGRQVLHNGISIMAGNYADINLDTLPRMCDYERQQGAIAAMIAGLIPNVRIGLKRTFAKYINMVIQVVYIQYTRFILVFGKMVTSVIMNFKDMTKDTLIQTFESAVDTQIDSVFWAFIYFWETTGELLNEIKPGAGAVCESIVQIFGVIREAIKDGLVNLIAQVVELSMQFVAALAGNKEIIGPMFENAFKLWAKIQAILVQKMWSILGAAFDFFTVNGEGKEGFGVILKTMASTVCELLNTVMGTINGILGGALGWKKQECLKMDTDGRRLQEQDIDITQKIAETLEWNGTSVCDHFMTDVAHYKYDELRPLEKATWLECIEYKYLGIQLQSLLGSNKFPDDFFYNWKRKYMVAFDSLFAIKIILEHYSMTNDRDWGQIRLIMLEKGIDADLYIKMVQSLYSVSGKLIHTFQLTNVVETVVGFFDPQYQNEANPSESAKIWRTYSKFKIAADTTASEWTRRDMSKQVYQAKDAMIEVNQHLHKWWATVGTEGTASTHTTRTFGKLKRKILKGWHHMNAVNDDHRRKKLKTPLVTHIKTCKERGDGVTGPTWCTNCNIMDNAVEAIIIQTKGLSNFYTNTQYGLPWILENVTLYFDELAQYNSEFFGSTFTKLSETETPIIPTDATRWTFYVARDWELLLDDLWLYMGNASHKQQWLNQVDKLLNASKDFVSVTDSTYIPFYGYSFFHVYDYIFFSTCSLEKSIFVTTTTREQRLEYMDNAIIACIILILVIVTSTTWSAIPLVWMANTLVIATLVNFLYLYMVYGYMISCYPLSPYTLVEDINAWYQSRLDPGCFYKNFPNLAINPSEDTCLTCSIADPWTQVNIDINDKIFKANKNNNSTFWQQDLINISIGISQSYIDCAQYVSNTTIGTQLTLPVLMEEYFIFWPSIFWLRWKFPSIGTTIVEWGLFSLDSVLGKLALSAYQQEPVDVVWIECYNVMWLDNIVAGIVVVTGTYIALKMAVLALRTLIQLTIFAMYTYTTLGYLSLSLEKSVVEKAKLQ